MNAYKENHGITLTKELLGLFYEIASGVVVVDAENFEILFANKKACEIAGFTEDELSGRKCYDMICEQTPQSCPMKHEVNGETNDEAKRVVFCGKYQEKHVIKNAQNVIYNGRSAYFYTFSDISENLESRRLLRQKNKELSEREKHLKRIAREAAEAHERADKVNETLERELEESHQALERARLLQHRLIQKKLPNVKDINIKACYMPCENLGGDFFRIHRAKRDDKLSFIIGDCTGHGTGVSLDAALFKAVIEENLECLYENSRTDVFMKNVNAELMEIVAEGHYPTLFAAVLDLKTKKLYYSNANGEIPVLIRNGGFVKLDAVRGFHLGYMKSVHFERGEIDICPGDLMCFFSDAVREIRVNHDQILDISGIGNLLKKTGQGLTSDMKIFLSEIQKIHGKFPLDDDMTLVFFECIPEFSVKRFFYKASEAEDFYNFIKEKMYYYSFSENDIEKSVISLSEMIINAVTHGHKNDFTKKVEVSVLISTEYAEFIVKDEGEGFKKEHLSNPVHKLTELYEKGSIKKLTHGRGVWLTEKYMDYTHYNKKGNEVCLIKQRSFPETLFPVDNYAKELLGHIDEKFFHKSDITFFRDGHLQHFIHWSQDADLSVFNENTPHWPSVSFGETDFLSSKDIEKIFELLRKAYHLNRKVVFLLPHEISVIFDELGISSLSYVEIDTMPG